MKRLNNWWLIYLGLRMIIGRWNTYYDSKPNDRNIDYNNYKNNQLLIKSLKCYTKNE